MVIEQLITQLHDLARENKDIRIRKIADELSEIAKEYRYNLLAGEAIMSDKGYEISTLEKQEEFAKKRNYPL